MPWLTMVFMGMPAPHSESNGKVIQVERGEIMTVDAMMLGVYRIPEIKVDSGTDWLGLAGIILTAFIVVLGTWTTVRNFKITTDSQEKISKDSADKQLERSKAENVAKNRQEWINGLRLTISNFIASCFEVRSLHVLNQRRTKLNPETFDDLMAVEHRDRELRAKIVSANGEARRYLSLIELYINPEESDSQYLVRISQEICNRAADEGFMLSGKCDDLVKISQSILKSEWERVKKMV